jgi:hypothetical protein
MIQRLICHRKDFIVSYIVVVVVVVVGKTVREHLLLNNKRNELNTLDCFICDLIVRE